MRPLGQGWVDVASGDPNDLFTYLADASCDQLGFDCLPPEAIVNLGGCFEQNPPPGVHPVVYAAFCQNMRRCNVFDVPGCEPETSEVVTNLYGPPPDCLDDEWMELLFYCESQGYQGNYAPFNTLCYARHAAPDYAAALAEVDECVDCLQESDIQDIVGCLRQGGCDQEWLSRAMALPVCDAAQQALEDQAAALLEKEGGCLPDDAFGDVLYCLRHGDAGPDATRNALCWLLAKLGMQSELASVPRCDGPPRTAAEQVEIDRRLARDATAEATEPVDTTVTPPDTTTRTIEPSSAAATAPAPTGPARPPPPADEGVPKSWIVGGAVAAAALVGAGIYFARKK